MTTPSDRDFDIFMNETLNIVPHSESSIETEHGWFVERFYKAKT